MYAWDFPKENSTKDAIGLFKQRASQRRRDQQQLGNGVGWSDWVQGVGALSGSDPSSQPYVDGLCHENSQFMTASQTGPCNPLP